MMRHFPAICVTLLLATTCSARVIYVDSGAAGLNNGTTWQNAYKFLQDALADANNSPKPAEIRVAKGTYKPDSNSLIPDGTGDRNASFYMITNVAIKGGYAGSCGIDPNARDFQLYETILSGDLAGNDIDVNDPCDLQDEPTRAENSLNIVIAYGVDQTAVLDGFTITGGRDNYVNGPPPPPEDSPLSLRVEGRNYNDLINEEQNSGYYNITDLGLYYPGGAGLLITAMGRDWPGLFKETRPVIQNCTFRYNSSTYLERGAGIGNNRSSPVITDCTFEFNYSPGGSGICNSEGNIIVRGCVFTKNYGGLDNYYPPICIGCEYNVTIDNCQFIDNYGTGIFNESDQSTFSGKYNILISNCLFEENAGSYAGGIYNTYCSPQITQCQFINNKRLLGRGGRAIYNAPYSFPKITGCIFKDHIAKGAGGGIYNDRYSKSIIEDSIFSSNGCESEGFESSAMGGAIYYYASNEGTITNCIFWKNFADYGSGIYYFGRVNKLSISNCTFYQNTARLGYAIAAYTPLNIKNSILFNDGSEISQKVIASYCDIQGGWAGVGNIDADPLFADPNNGDFHLKSRAGRWDSITNSWVLDNVTSPCIDAGDWMTPIGFEPFPNGGRINMGAYGGTIEASKSYFEKEPCQTIIAGDINGDCIVNLKDFAIMAFHWLEEG